jgi:hypothetical protein
MKDALATLLAQRAIRWRQRMTWLREVLGSATVLIAALASAGLVVYVLGWR